MGEITRGDILRKGEVNTLYLTNNRYLLEMEDNQTWMLDNYRILYKNISTFLFQEFEKHGVPTHFVSLGSNKLSNIIRKSNMIKLRVKGTFIANSSLKQYGIRSGTSFNTIIFQIFYKNRDLNFPLITESLAVDGLNLLTEGQMAVIKNHTYIVGITAQEFFKKFHITLSNFTIEFGFDCETGKILLCDIFSFQTDPPSLMLDLPEIMSDFIS